MIEANNKEIEQKVQELAAKDEEIADLKSDLKDIHEEKLALENNNVDTIIPTAEQALMHENLKLQMDNDKLKATVEEKDVRIMELSHVPQQSQIEQSSLVQENQPAEEDDQIMEQVAAP